eukprot:2270487-Pleurochrysis_carterae.AAC.1
MHIRMLRLLDKHCRHVVWPWKLPEWRLEWPWSRRPLCGSAAEESICSPLIRRTFAIMLKRRVVPFVAGESFDGMAPF